MPPRPNTAPKHIFAEFALLSAASSSLHGYFLHRWLNDYLALISRNVDRLRQRGLLDSQGEPVADKAADLAFELDDLDFGLLADSLGIVLHTMASHKQANRVLLSQESGQRVLYLRGYDFENAVSPSPGIGLSLSTVDTRQFTNKLVNKIAEHTSLVSVLSSRDLYWETASTQRYFRAPRGYDQLVQLASRPPFDLYLNGNHWRADLELLVDQMDFTVVYLSSITNGVLWELDMLERTGNAVRTVVVIDRESIDNKRAHDGSADAAATSVQGQVTWRGAATMPTTVADIQAGLSDDFTIMTVDEFDNSCDLLDRIAAAGLTTSGRRNEPMPFRFLPAVEPTDLATIQSLREMVETQLNTAVAEQAITSLPRFFNVVQLKIYLALITGDLDAAGDALACHAAICGALRDKLPADSMAEEALLQHHDFAIYAGQTLLSYGPTDFFGSRYEWAVERFNEVMTDTTTAVEAFFASIKQ